MSRRRVRGDTCSRPASSAPGQYRRACSSDSNRSVRVLVLAMSRSSWNSGQEVAAMAHSVSLDRNGNPPRHSRKAQTMTTSTPITRDLAAGGQADASSADGERADLLTALAKQRHFLRFTTRGLTDEQAAQRTTVSELCLGGLVKHVTAVEQGWVGFIMERPSAMKDFAAMTEEDYAQRADQFRGATYTPVTCTSRCPPGCPPRSASWSPPCPTSPPARSASCRPKPARMSRWPPWTAVRTGWTCCAGSPPGPRGG